MALLALNLLLGSARAQSWTESVIYSFCSLQNCAVGVGPIYGVDPVAPLVFDKNGNLYGETEWALLSRSGSTSRTAEGEYLFGSECCLHQNRRVLSFCDN